MPWILPSSPHPLRTVSIRHRVCSVPWVSLELWGTANLPQANSAKEDRKTRGKGYRALKELPRHGVSQVLGSPLSSSP